MSKDHRAELATIRKKQAENVSQQRAAKGRRDGALRARRFVSARLKYFRSASTARSTAQRLIGWRAGMVLIYVAVVGVMTLFFEIVFGHAWTACAFGLALSGVLVALHYFPGDAKLAQSQKQAAEESARLTSLVQAQNAEIEHLKVMADVLKNQQSAVGLLAFGVDPADVRRRWTSQMDNLASRLLFHSPVGLLLYLLLFVGLGLYLAKREGHSDQEPTNRAAAERFRRERGLDQKFWNYAPVFAGAGGFAALVVWGMSWWIYRVEGEGTKCPACHKTFAAVIIHRSVKKGDLVMTSETVWQEVYDASGGVRPKAYIATRNQPVLRQEHDVRDLLVCKFCWHCWSSSERFVA